MEKIILATNNKGKIAEIKEILKDKQVISLIETGISIEVEEDQTTFEGNAIKKATEIAKIAGETCIADDSGLCIEALDGFPGVKTARFLGEEASQEERNNYLLKKLEGLSRERRKAEAITCIAMVQKDGTQSIFKGVLKGYIATEKRGSNGFGFDEIFELEDGRTLAELDAEEKNKISSRRKALELLKDERD